MITRDAPARRAGTAKRLRTRRIPVAVTLNAAEEAPALRRELRTLNDPPRVAPLSFTEAFVTVRSGRIVRAGAVALIVAATAAQTMRASAKRTCRTPCLPRIDGPLPVYVPQSDVEAWQPSLCELRHVCRR